MILKHMCIIFQYDKQHDKYLNIPDCVFSRNVYSVKITYTFHIIANPDLAWYNLIKFYSVWIRIWLRKAQVRMCMYDYTLHTCRHKVSIHWLTFIHSTHSVCDCWSE